MLKPFVIAFATAAALGASAAHAGGVSWSVAIDTPLVGTVISNAQPVYAPGYYVSERVYERGDERGYRGERGGRDYRDYRGYGDYRGAPVPVVVGAPGYASPIHAGPVYARTVPVYVAPVAPVVYPQRWDRHHRRVIVAPAHRGHHHDRWHHEHPGRHGNHRH